MVEVNGWVGGGVDVDECRGGSEWMGGWVVVL